VSRPGPETGAPPGPMATRPRERQRGRPQVASPPRRSFFAELPVLMLIAFGLALLLKTFILQAFFIPSRSMEPTLLIGDRVLVNKVVYELRDPERGEVVVFTHPDGTIAAPEDANALERLLESLASGIGMGTSGQKDFIKRVIGLPGDTIELRDGVVFVNGQELSEAPTLEGGYLSRRDQVDFGPVTVREGHYFMMGDNRPNSDDSRGSLGQIPREEIVGRAFVIIWPITNASPLSRPDYSAPPAFALPFPG
jgi:signal peptidase I